MWHDMFVIQIPVLEKILRTLLVYVTIVILFRLVGKRDLATFNTFDFVVIFLLSNVVQNAIIGNDDSLSASIHRRIAVARFGLDSCTRSFVR